MVVGNSKSTATKMQVNRWQFRYAVVRRRAHRPMDHIRGFTRSHWMQPLGECLRGIAPAAAMVDEFVETTQNTNKKQFLAN
jgi:hypothetical protein